MQKSRRYTVKRPDNARNSYRHSTSPFLSRITFHWVTDLLSRGYHTPLELHDLGQLPDEETTRNQFERFRDIYEAERVRILYFLPPRKKGNVYVYKPRSIKLNSIKLLAAMSCTEIVFMEMFLETDMVDFCGG